MLVCSRGMGLRSQSEVDSLWLADLPGLPGWLSVALDLVAGTGFVAIALALLVGGHGLPAHVTGDRVAWLPAVAYLCLGGAAMSGAMATATGGALLGAEIFVAIAALLAIAACLLGIVSAAMVVAGVQIFKLFDRLLDPDPER